MKLMDTGPETSCVRLFSLMMIIYETSFSSKYSTVTNVLAL
jgi:hypothetical protein